MKVFNDPDNLTTLVTDPLPDPAVLSNRTLKAIIRLFATLGPNPAMEETDDDRVDEWFSAVVKEDARRHPNRAPAKVVYG